MTTNWLFILIILMLWSHPGQRQEDCSGDMLLLHETLHSKNQLWAEVRIRIGSTLSVPRPTRLQIQLLSQLACLAACSRPSFNIFSQRWQACTTFLIKLYWRSARLKSSMSHCESHAKCGGSPRERAAVIASVMVSSLPLSLFLLSKSSSSTMSVIDSASSAMFPDAQPPLVAVVAAAAVAACTETFSTWNNGRQICQPGRFGQLLKFPIIVCGSKRGLCTRETYAVQLPQVYCID